MLPPHTKNWEFIIDPINPEISYMQTTIEFGRPSLIKGDFINNLAQEALIENKI